MPKHGLFLIRTFPYMDRVKFVFSRIWTESENLTKYGKIRLRFRPYTGKYRSWKARISTFFTQWSPPEGFSSFIIVGD